MLTMKKIHKRIKFTFFTTHKSTRLLYFPSFETTHTQALLSSLRFLSFIITVVCSNLYNIQNHNKAKGKTQKRRLIPFEQQQRQRQQKYSENKMSVSCSFVIDNGAQFNYHIKLLLCTHFIYLFIEFNHAACSIYVYLCMNVRSVEVVVVVVVIYTILPDYGQFNRQK